MFIKAFSGGLKSSSKKGLLSAINELDDIADVNKLFKKSNISKKLASKLLDDSKFADALDKPYTKTASAAKEASSAVEKVAEASTSTASAVAEVGAATATSSASMTTMEAATAGLAAEETVATGATVGFGTAIKGFLVTVAPIAAALVAVGAAFKLAHDYVTKFDTAVEKAETSQSNFEQTKSELSSLQDELDNTKDKIKELKSSDKLTIADQAQLSTLKTQSKELQRQIDLKKKLADSQSQKGLGIELDDEGNITGDLVDIKSAFSSLDGYDPSVLFEKTANGVHLNATEAVTSLKSGTAILCILAMVFCLLSAEIEMH